MDQALEQKPAAEKARKGQSNNPRRAFAMLVLVAILAMVAGFAMGRLVRSPEQQIADAQPPALSTITAEVKQRDLESEIVTRGTIALGRTIRVGPVKSSSPISVITKVGVEPGAQVPVGKMLLEVSGRPIFLLQGDFPAYRNLAVGDKGPDVAALNTALRGLKLVSENGDTFTRDTQKGLAALYQKAGYEPPKDGGLDLREVVFVAGDKATILSVAALVGETSQKEDLVVLSAGEASVTAKVSPSQAASIKVGNTATISLSDGKEVPATVATVTGGETLDTTEIVLRPEGIEDAGLDGSDVRVVIKQTATGRSALTVPVSAIFARSDGQNVVARLGADNKKEIIAVNVGDTVGGFVAVTPTDGSSALKAGDQVIVSAPGAED